MMIDLLTKRENEIIYKKINGLSLTQNESNILSKYIRPKLKKISKINAEILLNKLEYNQKARSIENKIRKMILKKIKDVVGITIFGSAIQTNYNEYNDIDALILTKVKTWKNGRERYDIIRGLERDAKKLNLILDIQLIDKTSFKHVYPRSPSLIYQLKDSKEIYGNIKVPSKTNLLKLDLRMKLD